MYSLFGCPLLDNCPYTGYIYGSIYCAAAPDHRMETKRAMDIFEDLKRTIGCAYISDMAVGETRKQARIAVRDMDVTAYPFSQLSDLYRYLYAEKRTFSNYDEAMTAFGCRKDKIAEHGEKHT